MRQMCSFSFLLLLFLAQSQSNVSADGTTALTRIPNHIQTSHIWSFLHWRERFRVSEWSASYHTLSLDTYPNEHIYQSSFYNLQLYVSSLRNPGQSIRINKIIPRFFREMTKVWWMSPKRCDRDMLLYLSEKLFLVIIEVMGEIVDASILCNNFIHRLEGRLSVNLTDQDPLYLMHEIVSQIRLNGTLNVPSLQCMFRFGLQEMNESGKKYNRYTEFAFFCLNAAVSMCSDPDMSANWRRVQMKHIWNALVSVIFLDDFLLLTELRHCDRVSPYQMVLVEPIHLILQDALLSDGKWNETTLMVISHHQHLFFDFPTIINFAIHKASAFGITQLLDFIRSQQLMDWPQIERAARDMLVRSTNPVLHAINIHIHRQMMDDFRASDVLFPSISR